MFIDVNILIVFVVIIVIASIALAIAEKRRKELCAGGAYECMHYTKIRNLAIALVVIPIVFLLLWAFVIRPRSLKALMFQF